MSTEIFCTIHQKWVEYLGGGMIPPDVLISKASCGHNLPSFAATREVEDQEPDNESENQGVNNAT